MVAILTGDIVNSRAISDSARWLSALKEALQKLGPARFEVFRGDSFQLETRPENSFLQAIYIKACLKTVKPLDVRIAIGIGDVSSFSEKLSESNGAAFVFSGEKFEGLKKERLNLAVKTSWPEFDEEMNTIFRLSLIAMDNWTERSAQMVKIAIEHPRLSQLELAELTKKSQSSVSEALKRAHFSDILELESLYRKKLSKLLTA